MYLCGECGHKFKEPKLVPNPSAKSLNCRECPKCGASPWNFTVIDEEACLKVSETYIVGIDITGEDASTLTVAIQNGSKLEVVNVIRGKQAEALYELLTTKL